jgi:hypothetical protein
LLAAHHRRPAEVCEVPGQDHRANAA